MPLPVFLAPLAEHPVGWGVGIAYALYSILSGLKKGWSEEELAKAMMTLQTKQAGAEIEGTKMATKANQAATDKMLASLMSLRREDRSDVLTERLSQNREQQQGLLMAMIQAMGQGTQRPMPSPEPYPTSRAALMRGMF